MLLSAAAPIERVFLGKTPFRNLRGLLDNRVAPRFVFGPWGTYAFSHALPNTRRAGCSLLEGKSGFAWGGLSCFWLRTVLLVLSAGTDTYCGAGARGIISYVCAFCRTKQSTTACKWFVRPDCVGRRSPPIALCATCADSGLAPPTGAGRQVWQFRSAAIFVVRYIQRSAVAP